MADFSIVNLVILSKSFLSEGGGGWGKTFRVSSIKILCPRRKFGSVFLSDLQDILKAFHKNKFHSELNLDTEKIADIVLTYFFTGCPSGGGHGEMSKMRE